MSASPLSRLFDVVTTAKGASLLAPAILLLGTTLAVGQSASQTPSAPASPPAVSQPASEAKSDTAAAASSVTGKSSAFSAQQREELTQIVKDILLANPEIMLEVQNALEARMDKIQADRMAVALKEHSDELFRPSSSPVVGNAKGDLPLIEFFDYNCGYCKKAFSDVASFVDKDKKTRFILKEFPILSKGSEEASRVALAAKMQGKYWEFHRAMIESQGQANEASALRTAEKLGLDMARLKRDMNSADVKKEIDDTRALAAKMGIQGTPHFIVGDKIIPGAPENLVELLNKHASDVRKDGCKVC
ncbi:MAG: DsbA family protein [Hyphomicrobiales bacterium]|nr:MAG: DsbA family protein [Hyphomicrobiales bacterium]